MSQEGGTNFLLISLGKPIEKLIGSVSKAVGANSQLIIHISSASSLIIKIPVKSILTLLISIIITNPIYSQQKSKILNSLQEELKDKRLYLEPLDSITKKLNGIVFVRDKNVSFPDFRIIMESQQHETKFEDIIKVIPNDLKLFGQYPVDTISYYFNQAKLIRCWYQFRLPTSGYNVRDKAVDSIYKRLNQNFNLGYDGVETNIAEYIGYSWTDDYVEVDFLTNTPKPRAQNDFTIDPKHNIAYISVEMFKPIGANILLEKQTAQIKADRSGKGNSTFNISIAKLESIVILKTSLKGLEAQLGNWNSYGNLNDIGAEYDDNTKNFTIPLFQIHYDTTIKNNEYLIEAYVSKNLKNPVKELHITTTLNGYQLAQFKESLHAHGYLLNENLSATLNKLSYNNKARRLITISYNENGSYTIEIFK